MYAALWRVLPGPWPVRLLLLLMLLATVVWACLEWVYPWAAATLPLSDQPLAAATEEK